jgi:hypothetical protein
MFSPCLHHEYHRMDGETHEQGEMVLEPVLMIAAQCRNQIGFPQSAPLRLPTTGVRVQRRVSSHLSGGDAKKPFSRYAVRLCRNEQNLGANDSWTLAAKRYAVELASARAGCSRQLGRLSCRRSHVRSYAERPFPSSPLASVFLIIIRFCCSRGCVVNVPCLLDSQAFSISDQGQLERARSQDTRGGKFGPASGHDK